MNATIHEFPSALVRPPRRSAGSDPVSLDERRRLAAETARRCLDRADSMEAWTASICWFAFGALIGAAAIVILYRAYQWVIGA